MHQQKRLIANLQEVWNFAGFKWMSQTLQPIICKKKKNCFESFQVSKNICRCRDIFE